MISGSPLVSNDVFNIETPAKLRERVPVPPSSLCNSEARQNSNFSKDTEDISSSVFPEKIPVKINFGYYFADPTPLRLVSESPLVTPLKFLD